MKKSFFICCVPLLILLIQVRTVHADVGATFMFGAIKWVAILGVAAIFALAIRLIGFLFTKAKEKTLELHRATLPPKVKPEGEPDYVENKHKED